MLQTPHTRGAVKDQRVTQWRLIDTDIPILPPPFQSSLFCPDTDKI